MSLSAAVETLNRLNIEVDLELDRAGHQFQVRSEGQSFELAFSSWISLFHLLRFLYGQRVRWGKLWKIRHILKASDRHLWITVKGDRRFSIGA